jgi:hypothetical protein
MRYKLCSEIIGGARALLPMEVYAYALISSPPPCPHSPALKAGVRGYYPRKKFSIVNARRRVLKHFR